VDNKTYFLAFPRLFAVFEGVLACIQHKMTPKSKYRCPLLWPIQIICDTWEPGVAKVSSNNLKGGAGPLQDNFELWAKHGIVAPNPK